MWRKYNSWVVNSQRVRDSETITSDKVKVLPLFIAFRILKFVSYLYFLLVFVCEGKKYLTALGIFIDIVFYTYVDLLQNQLNLYFKSLHDMLMFNRIWIFITWHGEISFKLSSYIIIYNEEPIIAISIAHVTRNGKISCISENMINL